MTDDMILTVVMGSRAYRLEISDAERPDWKRVEEFLVGVRKEHL
ncbi:hypothetical protein AB0392_25615 [Nonomuraea angiospora]